MTDSQPGNTVVTIVTAGAATLEAAGWSHADARQDAGVLARHALGWTLETWLAHQRDAAPSGFAEAFTQAIDRRATHEPIAYITGEREFYWRPFTVTPAVLIPRPETELVIEAAIQHSVAHPTLRVVDVGTGSGCIAVTIAAELHHAEVTATDISADALLVAQANARRHNVADRINFRRGAYFAGLVNAVEMIVSNPPYVAERDRATLAPDVVAHEPETALFGGADGLDCIRPLISMAPDYLVHHGALIMEFGFGQADHIKQLIACQPALRLQAIVSDLQGIPRVAVAIRV